MKAKSIFAASLLIAGAAFADTTTVETEYVLGVMPVSTGSRSQVILSIPWVQEGTGGNVAVSNVVKTAGLTAGSEEGSDGDTLTWYDTTAGKYETWRLVNRDGVYYWKKSSTASETSLAATDPAVAKFKQGEAMVLTMTGTPASTLYVVGQVGTDENPTTVIAGGESWTLLAPPVAATSDIDLNEYASVKNGNWLACVGDEITVDAANGLYKKYKCVDRGESANPQYVWTTSKYSATHTAMIPAGRGFWYHRGSKNTSAVTIEWQNVPTNN